MEKFKVDLYDEAIADLNKALKHYRDISPSLAKKLQGLSILLLTTLRKILSTKYDTIISE